MVSVTSYRFKGNELIVYNKEFRWNVLFFWFSFYYWFSE